MVGGRACMVGACVAGGMRGRGGHVWQRCMRGGGACVAGDRGGMCVAGGMHGRAFLS